MKNYLFLATTALALVSAAPAFAQSNDSTVTQTGTGNQATIGQTGSANTSVVDQDGTPLGTDGTANVANVTQAGVDGFSSVTQTGDNTANVTQTNASDGMNSEITQNNGGGQFNEARVTQRGIGGGEASVTGSFVTQTGTQGRVNVQQNEGTLDAVSAVTQTGRDQRVDVIQQNGTPNSLIIQNGGPMKAEVFQDGSSISEIRQSNRFHTAGVRQAGEGNFSSIDQTGVNGDVGDPNINNTDIGITDAAVGVFQLGDRNNSVILQTGTNQFADVMQTFGDNDSNINQSGDRSVSEVTQGGAFGRNNSEIVQSATDSTINSLQLRDALAPATVLNENFSRVDQSGADQTVILSQMGDENSSRITQSNADNNADVSQNGFGNTSTATQSGTNGIIDIDQDANDSTSTVSQTGVADFARVIQTGTNQTSGINQSSPNSGFPDFGAGALVNQSGADNVSQIDQSASFLTYFNPAPGRASAPAAAVFQSGTGNIADVDQTGAGGFSQSSQSGSTNELKVLQSGADNDATAAQNGANNVSDISQTAGVSAFAGLSLVRTNQTGDRNEATIDQSGEASGFYTLQAVAVQTGNDNLLTVTQSGTDARAFVDQIGDRNRSTVIQNVGGLNNFGDINQTGDDGLSVLTQSGTSNEAVLNQDGTFNQSFITQNGLTNEAFVNQGGAMDTSTLNQIGNGNTATVNQNVPAP